MKNRLFVICLLATYTLSLLVSVGTLAQQSAPASSTNSQQTPKTSTLKMTGLRGRVIVRRDERGVPHIEATNESDLYFAQGYATASDRLWQMDLLRRSARGELAEIFGRIALEEDKKHRRYGLAQVAEQQMQNARPDLRAAMESYARGVNAFIESLDEKTLPVEFRILRYRPQPWIAADCVVVGSLLAEDLSSTYRTDLMRAMLSDLSPEKRAAILPEFSPLDVTVVGNDNVKPTKTKTTQRASSNLNFKPEEIRELLAFISEDAKVEEGSLARVGLHAEGRAASNNWVVSGKRTTTGKPLLANDPHLAPTVPSVWYLVHLNAPGLHVAGVTLPGAPGVIIGHNERIAWGVTNLGPDVQ
ncbi:MAG TPA: penicillin acylase family protein, partial [Blastocatellia bacterium]|nr:penicillin acylase family protein [Blastocatellia bacterium]